MNIENYINNFFNKIENGVIEIYNEFSFQHELGIFLRNEISKPYKVEFERNVRFFNENVKYVKSEIDIVIYHPDNEEKYAIELKFPQNGQHPESMFSFIKDIKFLEQLKQIGFSNTYAVTYVKDKLFYSGAKSDGIYAYFRKQEVLHGEIIKPTGKRDEKYIIEGHYQIKWLPLTNGAKYYMMSI